jgi:hypothetical protein
LAAGIIGAAKASELAFAHALAMALIRRTELVIMHASHASIGDWARFLPVRKTLERWQVFPLGSPRSALFEKLAMRVSGRRRRCDVGQRDGTSGARLTTPCIGGPGGMTIPAFFLPKRSLSDSLARDLL